MKSRRTGYPPPIRKLTPSREDLTQARACDEWTQHRILFVGKPVHTSLGILESFPVRIPKHRGELLGSALHSLDHVRVAHLSLR